MEMLFSINLCSFEISFASHDVLKYGGEQIIG
jgi:hypothetical protein